MNQTLTAVAGISVGHAEMSERPTGSTVVLVPSGTVAAVDVRGGAPGTRETDLLAPTKMVQEVHAVLLTGGSAFGLAAADGVMRFLDEQGFGFDTGIARVRVPIVPAAVLFDFAVGDRPDIRPDAACGRRAAEAASSAPVSEGNTGAGAGASVGKLAGHAHAMRGGLGSAALRLDNGLVVAAMVAVNAIGNIVDPQTGSMIAGARGKDGKTLADAHGFLLAGTGLAGTGCAETGLAGEPMPETGLAGTNTTIGVVATNARLTQAEATKVAEMAQDGFARTIFPAHTPWDGDTLFCLATGAHAEPIGAADLLQIGALAAAVTATAVVRGVSLASGLPGLPAATDLVAG